ncbi:MAG: family 43 glycosylhydrolase, partial [Bacilli bacterium]|nr:family 43 glycosylhydrolase [Bacilli bacterium]
MTKQIFNPYLPSYEYVPDGEPRVFGDKLYVYGSHDKFNGEDFCLNDYVCWSAPINDLTNWRYEGVIYHKSDDPKYKSGKFQHMNAPDVIKGKDGKFYLYYAFGADFFCSVAVGDSPVGPFKFYGRVSYPNGKIVGKKIKDPFCFDPSIFIDDDGKIYLYVGFSPVGLFRRLLKLSGLSIDGGYGMELENDMKTIKKGSIKLLIPGEAKAKNTGYQGHGFYEASSMRKINNKYYYVYSSILSHELCYATSDSPLGDFTYKGTIVSIGDIGYKGNVISTNQLGN